MIGLGTIGAYGLAASFYKGDVEAAYAPIFGGEGKPDARPAPLADVATPLAWIAATHPELRPTYIILHDPGPRGQHRSEERRVGKECVRPGSSWGMHAHKKK